MSCKSNYFLTLRANFRGQSLTLHPPTILEVLGQQYGDRSIDHSGLTTSESQRESYVFLPERDRFRARNTYPFREFQTLGLVLAYVLYRLAAPTFTLTTRAAPARTVVVRKATSGALFRSGDEALLPMGVHWRVWHNVIVPVLQMEELQPSNPLIEGMVAAGPFEEYAFLIERFMVAAFQQADLLPLSL